LAFLLRDFVQMFVQSSAEFMWSIANALKDTSISMQDFNLMRNPSKSVKDDEPESQSTLLEVPHFPLACFESALITIFCSSSDHVRVSSFFWIKEKIQL